MKTKIIVVVCCFIFLITSISYAEYNVATKTNDMILINTQKEIGMGRRIAKQIEKHFEIVKDERLVKRVDGIGQRLAAVCDRQDLIYKFNVVTAKKKPYGKKPEPIINAFALPGGYVYIFKGMLDKIDSDDQLASVLGHEIGHIVAKHSVKRVQTGLAMTILQVLVATQRAIPKDRDFSRGLDLAMGSVLMEYSREDEFLADKLGVEYARRAGFDPLGTIGFLETMKKVHEEMPSRPYSYWRTHPYLDDRIRRARIEITGQMTFDDYINNAEERV